MRPEIFERRMKMHKAYRVGVRPIVFIADMAEKAVDKTFGDLKKKGEAPSNEDFEVWRKSEYDKEFEKLKRDWVRRKGPDGWFRKLAFETSNQDRFAEYILELDAARQKCNRYMEDPETPPNWLPGFIYALEATIKQQAAFLGMDVIMVPTEAEVAKASIRLQADQFRDLLYAADPELAHKIITKIVRISDLPNIDLKKHT